MKKLLIVAVMFIVCDRFINYKIDQVRSHVHLCKNETLKTTHKSFLKKQKLV